MSGASRESYQYDLAFQDTDVSMSDEPKEIVRFYYLSIGSTSGKLTEAGFGLQGMVKEEVIKLRDELNRALEE